MKRLKNKRGASVHSTKSTSLIIAISLLFALYFSVGCASRNTASAAVRSTEEENIAGGTSENIEREDVGMNSARKANIGNAFDFERKTVMLNSGYKMPILGLGTWTQDDKTVEKSVYHALSKGYRLIDTAKMYGNEKGVGNGVRRAIEEGIVKREDVFVTSKIVPYDLGDYSAEIERCNERLGLGYIDLMLIHQQGADEKELYKAIEAAIGSGTVRSLGISNYYTQKDFDRITKDAKIMPCIIQNENHPYHQNTSLQQYVSRYDVLIESYYPFGGRGHTQDLFNDETVVRIAKVHEKTSAQILLRWQLQAGYIAIPGSSNPKHIAENIDVFDFELSGEEMSWIAAMHTGKRYETW